MMVLKEVDNVYFMSMCGRSEGAREMLQSVAFAFNFCVNPLKKR